MEEYLEKLKQAAKDSDTFEAMLDDDLKAALVEVKNALTKIDSNLKIEALTELPEDVVNTFCEINDLDILPTFKNQLKTPYAIAKYLSLVVQQKELTKRIDMTLNALLDNSKISWVIHQNFSNTITFTKILQINSEEKPQSLLVKYRVNNENDQIVYSIMAGNWGWDITANQLKALLEGAIPTSENTSNKMTYSISDNTIVIQAGNIQISVNKG